MNLFLNYIKYAKFGKDIIITSLIIGTLFISFTLFCFLFVNKQIQTNNQNQMLLDDVHEAAIALYEALLHQETGHLGFNLTQDERFLEPYLQGTSTFSQVAEQIIKQAEQYPQLNASLYSMLQKGELWHNEYVIPQIEMTKLGVATTTEQLLEERRAFDTFQDSFREVEQTIEAYRTVQRESYKRNIKIILSILIIISVLLLSFTIYYVFAQIRGIIVPVIELARSVKAYAHKDFHVDTPTYQKDDEFGQLIHDIGAMRNQLQEKFTLMETLADCDGLTGIANRRSFENYFQSQWEAAVASQKPLSFIMVDIDFFKQFNDSYGHLEGDQCLQLVASTLESKLPSATDLVARFGGEEFSILLPNTDESRALAIASTIRKSIESLRIPHCKSTISQYVTTSIGVATILPTKVLEKELLMSKADQALYTAKNHGRNQVKKAS